ncbi:hypothetical protein GMD51_05280 [Ruthenibacterium lactatiformans]|nr:uroporphyrinogen decarboxylase family protein [Ruthenibacterium lactatiformans]MTS18177.1 hypothetical protein [Ruthenibacterium lactatiformans]
MTNRERFIRTLRCEKIGGQVPTFELVFFLTMEAFGQVHPSHRYYAQWNQMSAGEKKLHMKNMAQLYIDTAQRYGHSAIFIHPNPEGFENTQWLLEEIRDISGNEYYIMMHGDTTQKIPGGNNMMEFSVRMYEEPETLHEESKKKMERLLALAEKLDSHGHLLDGFALCSDYCFNVNPFFSPEQFDEFIVPYLKETIAEYRRMGYYTIKHSDGNILPVLKQIAACNPHAIVPFPVSWTVKMKKKQKETQDILSYHTQAAGCSDKARAKASGGRQPIEECGRTGL